MSKAMVLTLNGNGHKPEKTPVALDRFIESIKDPALKEMAKHIVSLLNDSRIQKVNPEQFKLELFGLKQLIELMVMDKAREKLSV